MADPNLISAGETGGPPPGVSLPVRLLWSKRHPPEDPAVSFQGKTVLVTGANTGLGFEAAVKYTILGADKVILGVRSASKGEEAKRRIMDISGCSPDVIIILQVDLADFGSVKTFVRDLEMVTPKLDVALLNAGLGNPTYEKSGRWELSVKVNVLSTALMAILILPLLRSSAAAGESTPHLSFVNSHGHSMVSKDSPLVDGSLLKTANDEETWEMNKSYSLVKLLGMAVMQTVARMAAGEEQQPQIIVNAVCPDLCKTDLGRKWTGLMSNIGKTIFYALFARTAEQGARSLVSATALGPESHGRFWHHDILYPFGDLAQDEALMHKTWNEIVEAIAQEEPDILPGSS
ncbi:short-chain dehydrogenase/reductase [Colletotrichum sublineola]|uniref:Putative short-chain dehydrogenase/reductase n=1 Tax=Colletotrichum sublineola TaxID=1173701 RepID=A0A066XQJ4_COLSU|nr:short-chain dehydrogenase/reductase [Colletotrichum sublineola]KDN69969.1 putative short-chain dehydrogenase/reductase [Colletotrichum sublineola]